MVEDYPENDGTDASHPAWLRGVDYGSKMCMMAVERILDGLDNGSGVCSEPWESLRRRLLELVKGKPD